jgi:hypothetical protein
VCQNCFAQERVASFDIKPSRTCLNLPPASSYSSTAIRFRPYDLEVPKTQTVGSNAAVISSRLNDSNKTSEVRTPVSTIISSLLKSSESRITPVMGVQNYRCYICSNIYSRTQMQWLSTSAEGMNSHAMHFPCLRTLAR